MPNKPMLAIPAIHLAPPRRTALASNETDNERNEDTESMWLIVLEALGALAVLVFLIWWTMFSGRRHGELHDPADDEAQDGDRGGSTKDKG